MTSTTTKMWRPAVAVSLAIGLLLAWMVMPTGAGAHPDPTGKDHRQEEEGGVGVLVNSPDDLAGFLPANHWSGSGRVANQTADLVYVGTGCTPVPYLFVDVEGKIALIDDLVLTEQPNSPFSRSSHSMSSSRSEEQPPAATGTVESCGQSPRATTGPGPPPTSWSGTTGAKAPSPIWTPSWPGPSR